MDSFYNTKVKLGPWLWKIDATYGPQRPKEPGDPFDGGPIESLRIQSLAKIPDFLHHPEVYFFEIQATYQLMLVEVPKLRGWLAKTLEQIQTLSLGAKAITFHTRLQSSYALLITMALLLNGILRAFDPLDISLINEAMHIPSELLEISKDASKFRPLGASYMPLCLMTAWAATPNILDRPAIEEMIEDYSTDFAIASWMVAAVWLENQLNGIRLRPATSFLEQRFEGPIDASWKLASALDGDPRAFEHTGGECSVS